MKKHPKCIICYEFITRITNALEDRQDDTLLFFLESLFQLLLYYYYLFSFIAKWEIRIDAIDMFNGSYFVKN